MRVLLLFVIGLSFLFGAVDINNASQEELESLKGVGAKKAEAIVKYREGKCFESPQELTNVKGIGEGILAKNKDDIVVGKCK
jgi:competence protein ComEA